MKFRTVLSLTLAVLLVFSCLSLGVSALGEGEEPVQVRRYASFGSEQTDADALGITPAKYQQLLERIFGAIRAFESSCSIADFGILKTDASRECLSRIVFKEDPTLFQVGEVSFSYSPGTNAYTAINFRSYKYDKDAYVAMLAACDRAADQMTADLIDSGLSQAELALILHDRLAIRCGYDYDNYLNRTVPDESYTMCGPLVNRTAVCEGYSLAYRYLLARVGINSRLCVSEALNHAWNIVEIDGESYHVDVTWDDPTYDVKGKVLHENFLRSTEGIRSTGHEATDFDSAPQSARFEDAWWRTQKVGGEVCYLDGSLYYIDGESNTLCSRQGDRATTLPADLSDVWYAGADGSYWRGKYVYLASDGTWLYYNKTRSVWRCDPATGAATECFRPDLTQFPDFYYLYAFTVEEGEFVYEIYNTPNFTRETLYDYTFRAPIPAPSPAVPAALSVQQMPLRRVYGAGSEFDAAGLILGVEYSDGTLVTADSGFTAAYDFTRTGERTVTVTYEGLTLSFTVTVTDLMGDLDGDGAVTSTDARMALVFAVGKQSGISPDPALADADGDGKITATDARLILQYAVELIDDWPAAA